MIVASYILLALVAVVAIADWVAVSAGKSTLEYVAKPATTLGVVGLVASLDVAHDARWWLTLVALVFGLVGDVFLMLPRDSFIQGLISFAIAQILFTVGFLAGAFSWTRLVVGAIIIAPVAAVLARRFVRATRSVGRSEFVIPVLVYVVVISAMATSSIAAGSAVAVAGAAFFMVSDSMIAEMRFVRERMWLPVGIMVTYHLALVGLALGLL